MEQKGAGSLDEKKMEHRNKLKLLRGYLQHERKELDNLRTDLGGVEEDRCTRMIEYFDNWIRLVDTQLTAEVTPIEDAIF